MRPTACGAGSGSPRGAVVAGVPAVHSNGLAPDFLHKEFRSRDLLDHRLTIQVAPEDCTGCTLCARVCPAKDKTNPRHKAIDMHPQAPLREAERALEPEAPAYAGEVAARWRYTDGGGEIMVPPTTVPDMLRFACGTDPQGAAFGIRVGEDSRWFFVPVTIVALVLIALVFPALGFIFGGWLWAQGEARYERLRQETTDAGRTSDR